MHSLIVNQFYFTGEGAVDSIINETKGMYVMQANLQLKQLANDELVIRCRICRNMSFNVINNIKSIHKKLTASNIMPHTSASNWIIFNTYLLATKKSGNIVMYEEKVNWKLIRWTHLHLLLNVLFIYHTIAITILIY